MSEPPFRFGQPGVGVMSASRGQQLHLLAGQLYFGKEPSSIRTLLGSCVAITLWHPLRRIGGMCHYLLPQRDRKPAAASDARFGEEAVALLVQALTRAGTQPTEYEAHLYGGADTLPIPGGGANFNIGERNIALGWSLIDHYGFTLQGVDVGDDVPRTVDLSMADGAVSMRRGEPIKKLP